MTSGHWDNVSCPICPADTRSIPYLTCCDRLREPRFRNYHLVSCLRCGLIFLNPRPTAGDASEFYQEDGYDPFLSLQSPRRLLDRIYELARKRTLAWKKRLVGRLVPPGSRILDIGCGTGEFPAVCQLSDYIVEGIEPEPGAARWARERFGLKVHTGDLDSVSAEAGRFRLVTLWHVLEHMPNPTGALESISHLLDPEGAILIALPNIRSLDARIYGPWWVALDAPRHLWHFSGHQLELILQKSGFKLIRSGMLPLDTFYNSLHSELILKKAKGVLQILLLPFRLTFTIITSLLWGFVSGHHSGMYYIFRRY